MITTVYGTAGTGKTTWIINHVLDNVENEEKAGIFSFSTSAIQEIKERLVVSGAPENLFDHVRTIHSLAYINTIGHKRPEYAIDRVPYRFLRWKKIPFSTNAFDTAKKGNSWIASVTYAIQRTKSTDDLDAILQRLKEYEKRYGLMGMTAEEALYLYKQYIRWKEENKVKDFNDLLVELYHDIKDNGTIDRYDVIYVDEAQDLSPLTMEIILTAFEVEEIYLVGDPLQNIYENLLGTTMDLFIRVGEKEILLNQGHRVPQNIFDVALSNSGAPPKLYKLYKQVKHKQERGVIIERNGLSLIDLINMIREFNRMGYTPSILLPKNRHVVSLAEELVRYGVFPTAYKTRSPVRYMVTVLDAIITLRSGGKVDIDALVSALSRLGIDSEDRELSVLLSPLYDNTTKLRALLRIARRLGFVTEYLTPDTVLQAVLDTIHSAKGRENDVVIVPFFTTYRIKDMNLARRLFFVGVTRTKRIVVLLRNIISPRKRRGLL